MILRNFLTYLAVLAFSSPVSTKALLSPHYAKHPNTAKYGRQHAPVFMAAPGVDLASKEDLKSALANPDTVILDIRTVEEIAATGYWKAGAARWASAPGSREENPLLSTAANAVAPNTEAPVIVYCARGLRAAKAKEILESQGYTNVMNAGGYPGDMEDL